MHINTQGEHIFKTVDIGTIQVANDVRVAKSIHNCPYGSGILMLVRPGVELTEWTNNLK
jgi:hypothetical protein